MVPTTTPLPAERSANSASAGWHLENTYARLPAIFYASVEPSPVRSPRVVILNHQLATSLGLDSTRLVGEEAAAIFSGNRLPDGATPIAQAYAGHQYGHFTTLGDGRAILLGEQITPRGDRFDIQLKGSGPTPFSRRGDGRAALGPMLREYIISEAMQALRIPTTRSLAVTSTGEEVWRQEPAPGAVLTRVAASHIRVGTFQWAANRGEESDVRALIDYTIQRHYPEAATAKNPALALLEAVIARQAALLAQWMLVGFVHGVMNTDNMALSGETIDYGPCAFIDAYDPSTVFSSIDQQGRYAFGNQPRIAQWNLARFAETLLPVVDSDEKTAIAIGTAAVQAFSTQFDQHWLQGMRRKIGLFTEETNDRGLVETLLAWMRKTKADYTNTFAALAQEPAAIGETGVADPELLSWKQAWTARLERQPQDSSESLELRRANNPAFIPRNHLVEAALAAAQKGDLQKTERLLEVLAAPFDHKTPALEYREPAPNSGIGYQTFCGT